MLLLQGVDESSLRHLGKIGFEAIGSGIFQKEPLLRGQTAVHQRSPEVLLQDGDESFGIVVLGLYIGFFSIQGKIFLQALVDDLTQFSGVHILRNSSCWSEVQKIVIVKFQGTEQVGVQERGRKAASAALLTEELLHSVLITASFCQAPFLEEAISGDVQGSLLNRVSQEGTPGFLLLPEELMIL